MGWSAQHQTCLHQMGSISLTGARGSLLMRYQGWLTGFKTDLKGERGNIRPWQTFKNPFQPNPFYDSPTFPRTKNVATNFPVIQLHWKVWISSPSSWRWWDIKVQGWTLSPKYSLQTSDCILMLDAEMPPVFFQILQHSLNPSIWSCANWTVWEQQVKKPVNVLGRAIYIL